MPLPPLTISLTTPATGNSRHRLLLSPMKRCAKVLTSGSSPASWMCVSQRYYTCPSWRMDPLMRLELLAIAVFCLFPAVAQCLKGEWVNHGAGLENWRNARDEKRISPESVKHLALKWEFVVGDDTSATPAVYKGVLYFPSWNGNLYAVNQTTGHLVWSVNLTQLTGLPPSYYPRVKLGRNIIISRATPVVHKHVLFVGILGPAYVIAVNRHTGELIWATELDKHPVAVVTQSGTFYKGHYYVGVASLEEGGGPGPCCSFIGSFQKLDAASGEVVWKTKMLPDNGGSPDGYAGAAIWGSSPAIDPRRKLVFVGTGNVYSAPPEIDECARREANRTTPIVPDPCLEPENHGNSILAIELESGDIRWARVLGGYDAWTLACLIPGIGAPNLNCPPGPALDYDFGEAPMLLRSRRRSGQWVDVAVAAQKSGIVWALERDTGAIVWDAVAGPGGVFGGASWGSATDGKHVYVNLINNNGLNFTLSPSSQVTTGGGWVGIDAATGRIEWTTAAPNQTFPFGPVSFANGVLFVPSGSPAGDVYALHAKTGKILWRSAAPVGLVYGGFSISNGCAFVGAGYAVSITAPIAGGTPGTSVYAFCVPTH